MTETRKSSSTTFTYLDPGQNFNGDPYEAAGQTVQQTSNVLKLLKRAVRDTSIQVRNAYMQRNLESDGDPNAAGWEGSAEHKMLDWFVDLIDTMQKRLDGLHKAATYDPNHPPKE